MPDPIALAPAAAPAPAAPPAAVAPVAAPAVKSGWKTTELYAAMVAMGAIGWALEEIVRMLPTIAQNPAIPPWVAPILGLAPIGLGWLMKLVASEYGQLRNELKLGSADAPAAVAAGAVAASADPAATLAAGNK